MKKYVKPLASVIETESFPRLLNMSINNETGKENEQGGKHNQWIDENDYYE